MIRKANTKDIKAMCALIFKEYMEVNGPGIGQNFNFFDLAGRISDVIANEALGVALVAEQEKKVVGLYLGLYLEQFTDKGTPTLNEICWFVGKEARGRGVGRDLTNAAGLIASERGVRASIIAVPFTAENFQNVVGGYIKKGWLPVQVTFSQPTGA